MKTPLANLSLREQIVDILRSDVLCGRLAEGEHLNEVDLANRFGVSRTPVREAVQQLMHEGLAVGQRNAGIKVARRPPDSIRELVVPIRQNVETFALRCYFHTITEVDFALWNSILEEMRKACLADDFPSIAEQDILFHRALVRRSGQPDLEAIWSSVIVRVRQHFRESQRRIYDQPLSIFDEHVRILDVFRQGDLEASVAALAANIA
ncbi:MAG: GntR family transcriptional regulator [Planctomycetota bacterium]|nr:GntR family transcriptional regulator [Planctomycetota bacterium]MDA1211722.1 GntR family transcriptional regulator [Planctomycetota bacterium]